MRRIIAFLLSLIIVTGCSYTALASETVGITDEPVLRSSNVYSTSTSLTISNSGKATVNNSYIGFSGITTGGKITTKVQKKIGVIWVTVSGGSWTDTSSATNYSKSHSVQLSSTGTYRAHVVFVISGTGGPDDKITKNVQKTYS